VLHFRISNYLKKIVKEKNCSKRRINHIEHDLFCLNQMKDKNYMFVNLGKVGLCGELFALFQISKLGLLRVSSKDGHLFPLLLNTTVEVYYGP